MISVRTLRDLWGDGPLVALDVETTGLDCRRHRVIEIGLVRYKDGRLLERQVWPIRPEGMTDADWTEAGREALRINGLSREALADSPTFAERADQIRAWIEPAVVVAHNAPFDIGFLRAEYRRLGLDFWCAGIVDTKRLAAAFWPNRSTHLVDLCRRFELMPDFRQGGQHLAGQDAQACAELLLHLLDLHGDRLVPLHSIWRTGGREKACA